MFSEWARATCDRRRGVGGDGVLVILPAAGAGADARMRVINADGSIAEMCGNGLRCAALHVALARGIDRGELSIETDAGVRGDYWLRPNLGLSASVQYERWLFPVIQSNSARNVTTSVEIQFQPQKLFQRSAASTAAGASGRP